MTVAANVEVAPFQDRHGAIVYPRQVMHWLDRVVPNEELLITPPKNSFIVEEIGRPAKARSEQRKMTV